MGSSIGGFSLSIVLILSAILVVVLIVVLIVVLAIILVVVLILILIVHFSFLRLFLGFPGVSIPEFLGFILGTEHKTHNKTGKYCRADTGSGGL